MTPVSDDYLQAARVKASARRNASVVELADCLIAVTAVRVGATLVTANTSDFEAVQNAGLSLRLENWRFGSQSQTSR